MRVPKAFILLLSACVFLSVYAWLELRQKRQAAVNAKANLQQCLTLAKEISAVQSRPQVASLVDRSSEEITRLVEEAARARGLQSNQLLEIVPESRTRVNNTYESRPTRIDVGNVTLAQLVPFLEELESRNAALTVTSLRLIDPSDRDWSPAEKWEADVGLDYLIFSPK